jgi:hypothetical protein
MRERAERAELMLSEFKDASRKDIDRLMLRAERAEAAWEAQVRTTAKMQRRTERAEAELFAVKAYAAELQDTLSRVRALKDRANPYLGHRRCIPIEWLDAAIDEDGGAEQWETEARQFCQNADYWRERAERAEADAESLQRQNDRLDAALARVRALCDGTPSPYVVHVSQIRAAIDGGRAR